ncbi:MAG: PEGA domain-containing protein [Polyangiales bacterium]
MRLRTTTLALAALLTTSAAIAQTQPAPSPAAVAEARERFQRGVALSQEHNYNAAMVEFQRAYELTRNAAVLFNISATHELTGHFVEALDAMLDYERNAPRDQVTARRAEIDATLARLRGRIGTVVIRFEADGLDVRVDNLQRSVGEARTGIRVAAGRHRIALSAPHFSAREEEIDVAGGSTVVLSEPLVPERAFMAVDCNVAGAEILIDGHTVANTPTTSPLPVPEGTHHVMIRRPGFTTYETDVNTVGAGARVRAQLAWADPMPRDVASRVVVRSSEPDSVAYLGDRRVSLDGTDLVPPGHHTLRVEHTDFLPETQEIDLATGRENTVPVFLQPTPAFRESYFAGRRRTLITGGVVTGLGALVIGAGAAGFVLFNGSYSDLDAQVTRQDAAIASRATPTDDQLRALGCTPVTRVTNFDALTSCRNNTDNDRATANAERWAAVGVAGAGLITAVVGVVLLAGAPPSSRFDRHAEAPRMRLLGGIDRVGLQLTF